MASTIVKCYKEHFPALRLIGKCYTNADRLNGGYGELWHEWLGKGWFDDLERSAKPAADVESGYLGLITMSYPEYRNFKYWIGMLFPKDTPVPESYAHLDLPESKVGMVWVHGRLADGELIGEAPCEAALKKVLGSNWGDLNTNACGKNTVVFFERYNHPRFTTPDEKGNVILDYGFYLQ